MVEEINALDLLKEELTTEEVHLKVNAIHRMKTVILSIGTNETHSSLLPYLDSKLAFSYSKQTFSPCWRTGRRGTFCDC